MKAMSIIWGVMAALCLAAVISGACHHIWTLGISVVMFLALRTEDEEADDKNEESHGH